MDTADRLLALLLLAVIFYLSLSLNRLIRRLDGLLKRFEPHSTDPRHNPRKPTWKS